MPIMQTEANKRNWVWDTLKLSGKNLCNFSINLKLLQNEVYF